MSVNRVHGFVKTSSRVSVATLLTPFPYNKNEKSLHFPTQAETKNAIIFSYNIWP